MGISGYEVLIMTTISPFLLGASSIRRRVISHPHYIYALSLTGIVAFAITQQEIRLFLVSAGVFFSCLAWAGSFWAERNNPGRLDSKISAFSLGLLASNVAKFANYSNNPIWPIMNSENGGWNKTGLFLAILQFGGLPGRLPSLLLACSRISPMDPPYSLLLALEGCFLVSTLCFLILAR
jgi:hypothetical protein